MTVGKEFDEWATRGDDRGMEDRHWHTAAPIIDRMPVESDDRVIDIGCGSGYAVRALSERGAAAVGIDVAPQMVANARAYAGDLAVEFLLGDFEALPIATDRVDHAFSMEAFYYATDPQTALRELYRVLGSGGTFFCAVNFYEENHYSHVWADRLDVPMTLWSRSDYRSAFREAGFHVAEQDQVPDLEIDIPPADHFPLDKWDSRAAMIERYRELGTLLTVGVVP